MSAPAPGGNPTRRTVPTLIHDGKAWVEARHFDQACTDLDYQEDERRRSEAHWAALEDARRRVRMGEDDVASTHGGAVTIDKLGTVNVFVQHWEESVEYQPAKARELAYDLLAMADLTESLAADSTPKDD